MGRVFVIVIVFVFERLSLYSLGRWRRIYYGLGRESERELLLLQCSGDTISAAVLSTTSALHNVPYCSSVAASKLRTHFLHQC